MAAKSQNDIIHTYSQPGLNDPRQIWSDIGFGGNKPPNSEWFSGMPTAPGYNPVYDYSTMSMLPKYEQYMKNNDQGYNAFRAMALRPGASGWANLATTQQDLQGQDQLNKAVQTGNANTANAESILAMQGGLSSGARERAAESGGLATTAAEQGISRQTGQNKLQISMNDEQNRMSALGQLPGMENQRGREWQNVNANDTANMVANNQAKNAYTQNLYNQQMTGWAAGKQAEATANAGKK